MDLFKEFFTDIVTAGKEFIQPKVYKGAILAFLLLGGVASCTSCQHNNTVPPTPVPTVTSDVVVPQPSTTQTIESKKASVVLPIAFVDQHPDITNNSNYRLFANFSDKELVSLDSQIYTHSYEEFVLESIRFVKDQGAVVQSSNKITLGGQDGIVIESSKEGIQAWFFITVKDGVGYTFTCGGPETTGQPLHDLCFNLAKTFSIK